VLGPCKVGVRGANSIDHPEGGKARHLPVFEIRATHRSRTISFFLSRWEVGVPAAGWMVGGSGRRRPCRWPPAVVEAGGGGRSADRRLGFRFSGWWRRRR
jgi:hypothetical protein